MESTRLNHVALLLPLLNKAGKFLKTRNFHVGEPQSWEGEGTLEIYVGDPENCMATLLLMEPEREGSYKTALSKRGPGLHHICVDVLDIKKFILEISGSGWLLHPKSLQLLEEIKTVWLCRPGVPCMIEVHQKEKLGEAPVFISEVHIPGLSEKEFKMFSALGLEQVKNTTETLKLKIRDQWVSFGDLL